MSTGGAAELRKLVEWCDVFVFQGWVIAGRSFIPDSDRVLVADVYDPMHLEQLEQGKEAGDRGRRLAIEGATSALNEQLLRGDYFLCASDKQRDLWLGHLASLGRVNARTYDDDPSMRRLIDVVPFGVDDAPPRRTGPGAKGVIPGIAAGRPARAVGRWHLQLVRSAQPRARRSTASARRHPTRAPAVHGRAASEPRDRRRCSMAVEARRLAAELGLLDTHVFFNEGWVPYDERQNFLLDADVAVSMHLDHVETAFSFRTRVLDYLWASLPVVTTAGDAMAALVAGTRRRADRAAAGSRRDRVGARPPAQRRASLAASCRAASAAIGVRAALVLVLQPLLEFCREPRRAPDLLDPQHRSGVGRGPAQGGAAAGPRLSPRPRGRPPALSEGGLAQLLGGVVSRPASRCSQR